MSNKLTGGEAMVRMLERHGVEVVFGLCGDTTLPFYDAMYRLDHNIRHVLTRDERSAAYMADGYARVSGKVGVCEGPSGGGATYILPGLIEAGESSIPILAMNSDVGVGSRGKYPLTELDMKNLFASVTKWNSVVDTAGELPSKIRAAFRHMTTGVPGSAHLGFPFDVQKAEVDASEIWGDGALGNYPAGRMGGDPRAILNAVERIRQSNRPLILCGGGPVVSGAFDEVRQLAETIAAPVATSISGQGIIQSEHPLAAGVVGSNGGVRETRAIVREADLIVAIGCRLGSVTTELWRYPKVGGDCGIVHIDIDPAVVGAIYPTDAAIVGDAKLVLRALCELLPKADEDALNDAKRCVAGVVEAKYARFDALAGSDVSPILPERTIAAMQKVLPDDVTIVADAGTPCPYLSAYYKWKKSGRHFLTNRAHGALGYSLPAAVGAYFGRPDSKCVAVMGDGSFGFTAGELETIARHNIPVTLLVISNSAYGWIKAGQKSGFDERYFSVDFSSTDHAKVAEAFGVKSWRVEDPKELENVLKAAVAHDGPTLVDIVSQPLQDAEAPVSEWVA